MGLLGNIDLALQEDLMNFVKAQEEKPWPHTLGDALLKSCIEDICKGNARISGYVTNQSKKRVYIELTFWENETKEETEE